MNLIKKLSLWTVLIFWLLLYVSMAYPASVTLQWDANTEPDLAGYKIHYDEVSHCPNGETDCNNPTGTFVGTGATEGASPIRFTSTPANPEITINNLDNSKDYFFTITAFDTEDLESDHSNQVGTKKILEPPVINFADITLQWDANTEADLAAYEIHFDELSHCPDGETDCNNPSGIFAGTSALIYGDIPADSPINVTLISPGFDPINPEFTLKLNMCKNWFFSIKALDTEDLKSDYSNQVGTIEACPPEPPTGVSVYYNPI